MVIFLTRRLLVATIILGFSHQSCFLVTQLEVLGLLTLIYLIEVRPHETKIDNQHETMNELWLLMINY